MKGYAYSVHSGAAMGGWPLLLMPLSIFVAFIQTFVFILLSQLYLSEVSHAPHDEEHAHGHDVEASEHGQVQPGHAALATS